MTQSYSRELAFQNDACLSLMQSMLGLVTSDLLGVAIEFLEDSICVHFAITAFGDDIQEDLAEILDDFSAFSYPDKFPVAVNTYIGEPNSLWPGFQYRQLFRVKV